MTKDKSKPSVKTKIKDDIKSGLVKELKALTGRFGETSAKLDKVINKGAKKLAKRISKQINVEEPAAKKETPVKKAAEAKAKPAKAPVKKVAETKTVKAPVKTVTETTAVKAPVKPAPVKKKA